jgi:uncharacterized protein
MISRRHLLAAAALAPAAALPAMAIEAQPAPGAGSRAMPLDQHGYRSAQPVGDSVPWWVLGTTQSYEKTIDGLTWVLPRFSPEVRTYDGKVIRVNGYMMPLEESRTQRRFLLMAYPPSCPYCLDVGSQYFIEVLAPGGVPHSYDSMVIEGKFELIEKDENGLYYRLRGAKLARAR